MLCGCLGASAVLKTRSKALEQKTQDMPLPLLVCRSGAHTHFKNNVSGLVLQWVDTSSKQPCYLCVDSHSTVGCGGRPRLLPAGASWIASGSLKQLNQRMAKQAGPRWLQLNLHGIDGSFWAYTVTSDVHASYYHHE